MTTVRQPTKRRCSCVLTLSHTFICVYWCLRQRIHNTLIVVDRWSATHGDKTIPDSAEPRLESFYPPSVAGIDLPHEGVVDSYNLIRTTRYLIRLSCQLLLFHAGKWLNHMYEICAVATLSGRLTLILMTYILSLSHMAQHDITVYEFIKATSHERHHVWHHRHLDCPFNRACSA